jgi:hypothetical protein
VTVAVPCRHADRPAACPHAVLLNHWAGRCVGTPAHHLAHRHLNTVQTVRASAPGEPCGDHRRGDVLEPHPRSPPVLRLSKDCCGAAHIWRSGKSENSIGLPFRPNKDADRAEGMPTDVAPDTARRRLGGVWRAASASNIRRDRTPPPPGIDDQRDGPVGQPRGDPAMAINRTDTAPSVMRTASSHVRRAATCPSTCARNQGMQYPAMPTNPSYTDWAILNDRYLGRSQVFLNRHHATGFGADYVGCVSSINFSPPIGTIEAPRVIATMCRGIDAKLCPLGFNSPIYVRRIGECVPLWMPLKPHLIDQTSEFFDALHRMFYCVGQLVAAGERVPYLSDKRIQLTGTSLSSDFQRRSTQPVSIHLLLRRPPIDMYTQRWESLPAIIVPGQK